MSSGPSKVIVLDPDPRAGRQAQLGFEREGVSTFAPAIPADAGPLDLDGAEPAIVLVGGTDAQAVELVRRAKTMLAAKGADVPIVFTGHGASRRELEAAGADEVLERPLYLRDVVTIARMLRGVPAGQRDHLVGNLVETTGVLTLVRALSALGRSAVLTLIRGLRRGEVRFFHGEVTSAQVGLIHGQAALHQLLLWTDARFDYAHEDIVRRQQIPLSPDELFADAEHFLEGVREHAGQLSPATVLEQDVQRVHSLGKQIPTEVYGVLRMFDGHRVLADILEDSPYRVFETLRVAQKAVEVGLLRQVSSQRPKATWRAVLAIEEWLVGTETRDAVVERMVQLDSGPVPTKRRGKKRRDKKAKVETPPPDSKDIDWGALVPRVIGGEVGPLSGVVPAQETHGEVELPTRDKPREGLEALMDTEKRQRIFPTDIGLEPKVVIEGAEGADAAPHAPSPAAVAPTKAAGTETQPSRSRRRKSGKADTPPAGAQAAPAIAAGTAGPQAAPTVAAGIADTPPAGTSTANARTAEKAAEDGALAAGHAKSRVANLPARPPGADDIDPATAAMVATPQYLGEEIKRDPVTAVTSAPDTASEPRARTGSTDASSLVRALVAEAVPASEADGSGPAPRAASETNGSGPAPRAASDTASAAVTAPVRAIEEAVTTPIGTPAPAPVSSTNALIAEPITVAEAGATSVAVTDVVTVTGSAETAVVTATPRILISEQPSVAPLASMEPARSVATPDVTPTASTEPARSVATPAVTPAAPTEPARTVATPDAATAAPTEPARSVATPDVTPTASTEPARSVATPAVTPAAPTEPARTVEPAPSTQPARSVATRDLTTATPRVSLDDATPDATEDAPSDGVVRAMIATADTARMGRSTRMRPPTPEHDGPPIKETTGEIRHRPRSDTKEPAVSEPTILVSDLAAAHDAAAAAMNQPVTTPPPADAASPSRELAVSDVRRDAVVFSETEEAFFQGADKSAPVPRVVMPETFDDLDEGYQPPKFWDRVFGRKPKKPG